MKPICTGCQRFFKIIKTGYYFTEGMPVANGAGPGRMEPEKWRPYKVWVADLWACPDCGHQILSGFGKGPIAEHYEPNFETIRAKLKADQFQVNDC